MSASEILRAFALLFEIDRCGHRPPSRNRRPLTGWKTVRVDCRRARDFPRWAQPFPRTGCTLVVQLDDNPARPVARREFVMMRRMFRVAFVVIALVGVAYGQPPQKAPRGYRCGKGKPVLDKGCTCPSGMREVRDQGNYATCIKELKKAPTCAQAAGSVRAVWEMESSSIAHGIRADARPTYVKAMADVVATKCRQDGWPVAVVKCFSTVRNDEDVTTCAIRLEGDVRARAWRDLDTTDNSFRGIGSKPSPGGTGNYKRPTNAVFATPDNINAGVSFRGDSEVIEKASYQELQAVVGHLQRDPEIQLRIEGHTDNVGDRNANLKLSAARANAVRSYLIAAGIAGDRIQAHGYGAERPLLPNISEENRARNRRLKFVVVSR